MSTFLDYLSLIILIAGLTLVFYAFIYIHDLPYKIAKKRHHPQKEAIHVACWLSLFTLHALWPFVYIWAVMHPKHDEEAATAEALRHVAMVLDELSEARREVFVLAEFEQIVAQRRACAARCFASGGEDDADYDVEEQDYGVPEGCNDEWAFRTKPPKRSRTADQTGDQAWPEAAEPGAEEHRHKKEHEAIPANAEDPLLDEQRHRIEDQSQAKPLQGGKLSGIWQTHESHVTMH